MVKELLKVRELAKELRVSERTVYNWLDAGMPYVKVGFHKRFDLNAVMNWFEELNQAKRK